MRGMIIPTLLLLAADAWAGPVGPASGRCGGAAPLMKEGQRIFASAYGNRSMADAERVQNYEQALEKFTRALAVVCEGAEEIYFAIGTVQEQLQHHVEAADAFQQALAQCPREELLRRPGQRTRCRNIDAGRIQAKLDALRQRLGEINIQTPAGTQVRVDDKLVGTTPLDRPILANPGRHTVVLTLSKLEPKRLEVQVQAGRLATLVIDWPRPEVRDDSMIMGQVIRTWREGDGSKLMLVLDKGSLAGVKNGMKGAILVGPEGMQTLPGATFVVTDALVALAQMQYDKPLGENRRYVIPAPVTAFRSGSDGRVVQAYRSDGGLLLYISVEEDLGTPLRVGMTGRLLAGRTGTQPLEGGALVVSKVFSSLTGSSARCSGRTPCQIMAKTRFPGPLGDNFRVVFELRP